MTDLRTSIADALNKASAENASNTPDFILAEYLIRCLDNFDRTVRNRDQFHGFTTSMEGPSGLPSATTVSPPATPAKEPIDRCSVCGKPQRRTPSGMTCMNGHGGAPALLPGETPEEPHA